MSSAKKCDVCGRLYELYNEDRNENAPNGFMLLNIDTKGQYYGHDAHDCCPCCMEAIKSYLKRLSDQGGN